MDLILVLIVVVPLVGCILITINMFDSSADGLIIINKGLRNFTRKWWYRTNMFRF